MTTKKSPGDAAPPRSARPPEGNAEHLAALLHELGEAHVIFVARDEARARAVASGLEAGARNGATIVLCPGSDALPGENAPPSAANAGQRTSALRRLRLAQASGENGRIALVATGETLARLYPAPDAFDAAPPVLKIGDAVDMEALSARLETLGYFRDERVDEPGEYVVHGQTMDVHPADADLPCRMEIADGRIASVRSYDPATQLTVCERNEVELGRAAEPPIGSGVTLLDHMPAARVIINDGADERRRAFIDLALDIAGRSPGRAAAGVCPEERYASALARHNVVSPQGPFGEDVPRFAQDRHPMRAFTREAAKALEQGKVLLLGTRRDLRFIHPRAAKALGVEVQQVASWGEAVGAPAGSLMMLEMPVSHGFRWADMLVVSAADLLGRRAQREDAANTTVDVDPFGLAEIRVGDVVVHEDHGLCVVEGLEPSPEGGDALSLRFAADARRLTPVAQMDRVWRYGGEESAVTLDRLDGKSWAKRRETVEEAVRQTADEMARMATERASMRARILAADPARYERFASGFPFDETPDQLRAIDAVRHDLSSGSPMHRLVVGDVGFGKTEVALRAAAIAALAGAQVIIAAPTTVLVRQHVETFTRRFKGTGIEVASLSRLSTAAERKAVKAGLADGSIGIVIGTGAVAAKGVRYADPGLVIIDEEQRFGAADKAKLASLGADHTLTLSATPIPRTLQGALVGLQQLSVIATPPSRRLPIRTSIGTFDEQQLRAALLRERSRGGQSFVVVPRIEDLEELSPRLARLVPELAITAVHGKLPATDLDEAMVRFASGEGDVLLATNIIEAGLDVPRANTMAVMRADRFGLAQLHQLRGRVGRGFRRGRILLLTDPEARIAPRTLARLQALTAFDRLGAGFAISARDLDMRGAGDLLGEDQAGHARLIGLDLYRHLLETAIARARGEERVHLNPVVNTGSEGRLPDQWIPEVDTRINLYARLARIAENSELDRFEAELADRFGALPSEAQALIVQARLRILARAGKVARVDAGPAGIALTPQDGAQRALSSLDLEESGGRYLCKGDFTDMQTRFDRVTALMMEIA